MSTPILLPVVTGPDRRQGRDRLEILQALLAGPTIDAFYAKDLVKFPEDHPVYGWKCRVTDCHGPAVGGGAKDMCIVHLEEFRRRLKTEADLTRYHFQQTAKPRGTLMNADPPDCRICLERPARMSTVELCERHYRRHLRALARGDAVDFEQWCANEKPLRAFGECVVSVCHVRAHSPLGLCLSHERRYQSVGRPGRARVTIPRWVPAFELHGMTIPIDYDDEAAYHSWCATEPVFYRPGQVSLRGLPPLLKAELQWGLFARSQRREHTFWSLQWVQTLVNHCRRGGWASLFDVEPDEFAHTSRMIVQDFRNELRLVYHSPPPGMPGSSRPITSGSGWAGTGTATSISPRSPSGGCGTCCGTTSPSGFAIRRAPAAPIRSTPRGGRRSSWAPSSRSRPPRAVMSHACSPRPTWTRSLSISGTEHATGCHRWAFTATAPWSPPSARRARDAPTSTTPG
ncbi:hypothetical protein ACFY7C_00255 [Streptomyces sp. NPDC012769]|uniref:hypothetical protein n=1 Tax=Streptomyces sp. NPDC012769 TaxID=3364848 RepID=UPI0036B22E52